MSTSSLVLVVPNNDFLFRRPFLKSSSCFIISHSSFEFSLPQALSSQRPSFRIFSLSTQPQGTVPVSTTTTRSKRKSVAIYLMERLGFSEELSLFISKKLSRGRDKSHVKQPTDLIYFEKADNVITYLQEECGLGLGLDLSQVMKVISKYPRILTADVDKTLRPKIKLLEDLGFSNSDLALVLCAHPRLYFEFDLAPPIQALRSIMGSDEDVVKAFKGLKRESGSSITKNLIPNVTMLEIEYGISRDKIRKFLTKTPKSLMRNTESLREVLVRVEDKWGIARDSTVFLTALHFFASRTDDSINSKCQVFRSCGWSDSDILSLIRRNPYCLTRSGAEIEKKLDFYINEVGYNSADMASQTLLFTCSLENRVVPRHRVLSILKEKLLVRADYQLATALALNDNKFFDRFIRPFRNEVPELRQLYINGGVPTEELKRLETSENEPSTLVALE